MSAPVDVSFFPREAKPLTSYRKFWAQRFGTAPFLPMSREEMDRLTAHCQEVRSLAASKEPVGRKLDFLAQ